jgi:Protein of unknown function (DUF3040)
VPLSEREQQILEEIEKSLRSEDPQLARKVRSGRGSSTRGLRIGLLVLAAGIASLLTFFFTGHLLWGVLAFGGMVGGIVLVAGAFRTPLSVRASQTPRDRLEQRLRDWEERIRKRYKRQD